MKYRREIDGLRALAVLPVVFFHAGYRIFSGGFVGVDIFFVISGYLITTIILAEIEKGQFSVVNFYERRARRILPALYLVTGVTTGFAYAWMMPDELKSFGQSIVATALFSNNILLAITSGYWDLASEFKPLLHTWSLGVEEQYYIIFPFFLIVCWKHSRRHVLPIVFLVTAISLLLAAWGVAHKPDIAFYILPTRAWEILLGSLAAFYIRNKSTPNHGRNAHRTYQALSLFGFGLILISIFGYNQENSSPSLYTLSPTLGAVLIIIFAHKGTLVNSLLSNRLMVGIGLLSYSFYLWHQPVFALSRVYSTNPPSIAYSAVFIAISLFLAYLTWRFVESPFRNKKAVSRSVIFYFSIITSLAFISSGYYLAKSYGLPSRIFDDSVKIEDMDKRIYNERVFGFKNDRFSEQAKLKILVIGNSFGRDFVNMTTETFDTKSLEIIYRDDLSDCILPFKAALSEQLFGMADVIVFSSGFTPGCVIDDIRFADSSRKHIFYIGTKHFGYNLNWLIRLDSNNRPNQYNPLLGTTVEQESYYASSIPAENYISLLSPVVKNGMVPITDQLGRMLSTDRVHLTKYGAIFLGERALLNTPYGKLLLDRISPHGMPQSRQKQHSN